MRKTVFIIISAALSSLAQGFETLDGWRDDSAAGSPKSYRIVDGKLRISTRPGTRDRVKVCTTQRFAAGRYTWRVFVPALGKGDQASIGAFLYRDDTHEFDFEIGYGKADLRRQLKAADDDLVCYCTSQGHPSRSSQVLLKANRWYTLAIDLAVGEAGNYRVTWLVDDTQVAQLQADFGPDVTFTAHCSVENLSFIGDHLPTQENYALFDNFEFRSCCDWPMWRADAGRTGQSATALPEQLAVRWIRQLPALEAAYQHKRLQFDGGYEPIIAGGRLFLASSRSDSVSAYDLKSGVLQWRFYANGPVRLAPVAHGGKLYFGADDGYLYCLDAADGRERWRFRAVPSPRTALGNGRIVSVWPVRGGPIVADNTVYFAAGVWPFEGVFVYAIDAETGAVKWLNDSAGNIYGMQPHNARAIGGLTPQGYLVVNGDELVVPCSAAPPATFDRRTGALTDFELPSDKKPGGWFAALAARSGTGRQAVTFDSLVSRDQHEDRKIRSAGIEGLRTRIKAGERVLEFSEPLAGVEGQVHAMAAADGMLVVSTVDGRIYALGDGGDARQVTDAPQPLQPVSAESEARARTIVDQLVISSGYALVLGAGDGALVEALMAATDLRFQVVEADAERAAQLRQRWDAAGLYGPRVVVRHQALAEFEPPPYCASLLLCEAGAPSATALNALRPFGGIAFLGQTPTFEPLPGTEIRAQGDWTVVSRPGGLPGASNYLGNWQKSPDAWVRAPLGVLWFDDGLGHFKRSPQPLFVDGVMVSQGKDWADPDKRPYPLRQAVYTDIYTGRRIAPDDTLVAGKTYPLHSNKGRQPPVYRPAEQELGKLHGKRPDLGTMLNPLNGRREKRLFPKSYGCDGGIDYGHLISMRSGTAAFYDKGLESGTIHISGPRSGCTNSIIPSNGLLNLPYFYQGCTCSYPLPVALSMVKLAASHEQWASFGPASSDSIQRIGLNFGAPGDRMTETGTLWLDVPSVGGPSPELRLTTEPPSATPYYHHSLWIRGGKGWPWVAASGIRGLRNLTLEGLRKGTYTLRLTFAETAATKVGERKFDLRVQGRKVLETFDPLRAAGGPFRAYVHELDNVQVGEDGVLRLRLKAHAGETILSGLELGTSPLGAIPTLVNRDTARLHRGR